LFVSAGGYHHHVGLNTWAGVGVPPPPAGARGLDRFEVVVPDEASVAAVRERLPAAAEDDPDGLTAADPFGNAVLIRPA
jgi:catechol 2,3-dioxygenase